MKSNNNISLLFIVFLGLLINSCNVKQTTIVNEENTERETRDISMFNMGGVINSPALGYFEESHSYNEERYLELQSKGHQFKEFSPFIEYLDGGKKERLWFTSSVYNEDYNSAPASNYYYQLYYSERTIGDGKKIDQGWSEPVRFEVVIDNPAFEFYYNVFNSAAKGAVTIADDVMVLACEPVMNVQTKKERAFKNLWSLNRFE
ncbi:MAG TPA: hypothetical protein VJ951_07875, partial [Bacteroidales bacterium]|nr:hypothetical protein [Bacteroidales bacterium]